MSTALCIPLISMSMSEATIVEWLVADGTVVTEGQPIYSLETEKTVVEIEAPASGTLRQLAHAGITLPVGAEVGSIS